jgi:hypothetical protein
MFTSTHIHLRSTLKNLSQSQAKIMSRPTVGQPDCLGVKHPRDQDQISITARQLWVCWSGALSLTGGRVCRLQLLLVLASAVILGSKSRGTHGHIYCLKFETHPTWRARSPYLYPPGTGWPSSLFVPSYDSQGYGGGIRTRLHAE